MRSDEKRSPTDSEPVVEGLDGTGTDMSRILSLSDGVFSFALTFLVVSLVLPTAIKSGSLPPLNTYLASLEPAFLGYFLSFFIIAGWWRAHRRIFSPIVRYDELLVRINNLFLLEISVTPFLVGVLFEYGPSSAKGGSLLSAFGSQGATATEAVIIYGVTEVIAGLTLLAIWRHSTRGHRLVERSLPPEWIRVAEGDQLRLIGVFVVSIPIALVSPLLAEFVWIAMIFGFGRKFLVHRRPGPPARRAPADHARETH